MDIEDCFALHGESVAILHHYGGDDPGYKNVLDDRVRQGALALALAVLEEAEGEGLEMLFPEVLLARIVAIRKRIEALGKERT